MAGLGLHVGHIDAGRGLGSWKMSLAGLKLTKGLARQW